jgi:prepilin-type N-terminal cleavage/methylation domain-containing protein
VTEARNERREQGGGHSEGIRWKIGFAKSGIATGLTPLQSAGGSSDTSGVSRKTLRTNRHNAGQQSLDQKYGVTSLQGVLKMKVSRSQKTSGFTLVEIMIVVLIIGILLAIAIPNFVAARESSRAKACVANLKQIDSAKQQSAMDNKLSGSDTSAFAVDGTTVTAPETTPGSGGTYQLVGPTAYIRAIPVCPEGGVYTPATVANEPFCSVSDKAKHGDNGGSSATGDVADYGITTAGVPGKWYHGLSD